MKGGISEAKPLNPDISADLRRLPFPDNYVDEARAIHVIEHFKVWEAPIAVAEWVRVLKPGASLAIECPCLNKIIKLWEVPNVPPWYTYWAVYGDPRLEDELMLHYWCYTEQQIVTLMQKMGLVNVYGEPPKFHQPIRDMRVVGMKPQEESRIVLD